jgi:hypothetical protein
VVSSFINKTYNEEVTAKDNMNMLRQFRNDKSLQSTFQNATVKSRTTYPNSGIQGNKPVDDFHIQLLTSKVPPTKSELPLIKSRNKVNLKSRNEVEKQINEDLDQIDNPDEE